MNPIVRRRFTGLLKALADMRGVTTGTYAETPPRLHLAGTTPALPANPLRTGRRIAEQFVSNALYGNI